MPTLTLEEVNAAVRKHIVPENMVIALVSEKAETLADDLATEKPSPMTYQTPKPQEILDEDRLIAAYPLGIRREQVTVVPVDQMFSK